MSAALKRKDTKQSIEQPPEPLFINLSLTMRGETHLPYSLLAVFDNQIVLDGLWENEKTIVSTSIELDFTIREDVSLAADNPIILILRSTGTKSFKESSHLNNSDNKAGGIIDLYPLVVGQPEIFINVPLILIGTGLHTEFSVDAFVSGEPSTRTNEVPLVITMVSGNCLPFVKDASYISALSLDDIIYPACIKFNMSQNPSAKPINKTIWATASEIGHVAKTGYDIPDDDIYVPEGMNTSNHDTCQHIVWNAMKRVLVDPMRLQDRLNLPFAIEVAAVNKSGKPDSKSRYIGFVDAGVLLQPGQLSVTTSARLLWFKAEFLPDSDPLLDIPPSSAKGGNEGPVMDESGNMAYVIVKFDLTEPLMVNAQTSYLYEVIEITPPENTLKVVEELCSVPETVDRSIDVKKIRKECGALAVHSELSNLACRLPMNQSIKRTAANKLLLRVKAMIKQFPPGKCSLIEWQNTVTAHHAASRKAVTASFQPQPSPLYEKWRAVSKALMAREQKIADELIKNNLMAGPNQPKPLLAKALQCLEFNNSEKAEWYLLQALKLRPKSVFLLWIYGAMVFNKGGIYTKKAIAAFNIAANYCDRSDGTSVAIAWAALHVIYHLNEKEHAAFVAAKRMRKAFNLPIAWKNFIKRWEDTSEIEEFFWFPSDIKVYDPFLISAAFFLCLRCFEFSNLLLQCYERGCATRGTTIKSTFTITPDVVYIQASSLLLNRRYDDAIKMIDSGVKSFGPSVILSQLRSTCQLCVGEWDRMCENALEKADKAGAQDCAAVLLAAALGIMSSEPNVALQRVARAHKLNPNAYTALAFARIYEKLQETALAERWAAGAVNLEPLLADGWAFLAILALYERDIDKASTFLRTAKQSGEISKEIKEKLDQLMLMLKAEGLPESLMENLCRCEYV